MRKCRQQCSHTRSKTRKIPPPRCQQGGKPNPDYRVDITTCRYRRILNRIKLRSPAEKWERTRRLLCWIVAAKRSLKLYELQAIISMNPQQGTMEYEDRKLRAHITECCGALVQMVGSSRVELVHHTART